MSIDSNSECVRSKYFEGRTDMDESLSDFQEVKKNIKGPKVAPKPTKPKAKKVTKRIKGQKDIRTALKGKKNELVSYTKEFDNVCKKSGLDVDSEQLQLAIALSKSLQTESNTPESSQTLSSQQRVAKIRKTLQEYGFKVPEAKITAGKRTKKFRKKYKLLTVTEEEKRQNITEKYTKILFENLDHSKVEQDSSNNDNFDARVYYVASNIPYECMKDNNVFYINNLVEKSTTNGSLLRDWSTIPGRPESPKLLDTYTMSFKEIDCSQDELDIILSGSIKSVKDIFACKEKEYKKKYKECDVPKLVIEDVEDMAHVDTGKGENTIKVHKIENKSPLKKAFTMETPTTIVFDERSPVKKLFENRTETCDEIEIISPIKHTIVNSPSTDIADVVSSNKLTYTQQYRSCSPDIFDDELSSIMETTKPVIILSQEHKTKVFSQEIMDLTQCVNIASQNSEKGIQLSQNVTKRRSNDFMEITECIVGLPQNEALNEIDLTQSPEEKGIIEGNRSINLENVSKNFSNNTEQNAVDCISQNITDEQQITVVLNHSNTDLDQTAKENIDLTQSSNEDDKRIEGDIQTPDKKEVESMDLTQSSNSIDFDDLPLVDVANTQSQTPLDDTIIVDKDEYIANGKVKKPTFENEAQNQVFDLTQGHNSLEYNPNPVKVVNTESCSFYEDFAYDHSENSKEIENINVSKDNNSSRNESKESNDDIDLTQGSDTSEEILMSQSPVPKNIPNNSSLGKKGDVSIDYDEIIIEDNMCEKESVDESEKVSNVMQDYDSSKSDDHNDIEIIPNDDIDINSSQTSEIFHISDRELDYSLHKSRRDCLRDNFDIGGISVLNNVTKSCSLRKSLSEGCQSIFVGNKNDSIEDSFLPEVNVKRTESKCTKGIEFDALKTEGISPIKVQEVVKSDNGIFNIKTPKNTEYVIKTVDVTPMADYASMSTPQRNRELDRYGLKPLKRKRAIQILTHLYNQMHPTIQQLQDYDEPSPSKKPRIISYTQDSSPKKLITSPKNSPSKKNTGCSKTPVKSPRKFILRKPRNETRPHTSPYSHELDRDRHISSAPSSKHTYELERDSDMLFAPTLCNTNELERDRDILSAPSSTKNNEIKGGTDLCGYEVTIESAVVKSTDCSPDDWVFQKREKAKVHSCRVPLHIAFHNYVLSRRTLREAILKYEPVNIDVIHKDLAGYGHRYDPKDLLKFLDKKCITVKTTDNNTRNIKR